MAFRIIFFTLLMLAPSVGALSPLLHFDAMYQFGDSLSDTGNLIREGPIGNHTAFGRLPYGHTLNLPNGRCSYGLLIVDFLVMFFRLLLLKPYLETGSDFSHGVNFVVAGCTTLDAMTLASKNISLPVINSSLSVRLNWFRSHLDSICSNTIECKKKLEKALFIMGEIGGDDYNYAFFQGKSMEDLSKMVPKVVHAIKNAIQQVIDLGARHIIVPGNLPIGCIPIYLAGFKSNDSTMYDAYKCLKGLNAFAKLHNDQLHQVIQDFHRSLRIIYADYYSALRWVLRYATLLGFEKDGKACCGAGNNDSNFNLTQMCGSLEAQVCLDLSKRVSWDGIHLTQQGYKYMTNWLLQRTVLALVA